MARFSEQFIQQVAQAIDIVDLVSTYVALKKRGKEFVGLCPFHEDHKPSMYVSPAKQLFKCFACGAGGGVFQWMMMYDKLEFPEAVRTLAERAGIRLPAEAAGAPGPEDLSKSRLIKVSTFAARFYREQLRGPAGAGALEYALGRGLTDESIERFGLGYSPDSWDALFAAARAKGYGESELVAAGLAVRRETGGCYDRFRNRLMFPIIEAGGSVIGFGGRALAADERAKYLNSPESALFDKSANLYALNWSRQGIAGSGLAIVVEGYLDALIPLQAGVNNVVATLGTALTEGHVRLLSRYAREAVLIFDADTAGAAAAERALEIFLAQRLGVRVATIPAGKDPCDYTLAEGAEALGKLVADAPDALEYLWARRRAELEAAGDNLSDRRRVVDDFLRVVVSSSAYGAIDEMRRGQLAQHIGHLLNVSPADLQQQMRRLGRRARQPARQADDAGQAWGDLGALTERHLLEVLLNRGDLFDSAAEQVSPQDFADPDMRQIAECLWVLGAQGRANLEDLLANQELSPKGPLLAELAMSGQRRGNYEPTLADAVESMTYRRSKREMQDLKSTGLGDETLREIQRLQVPDVRRHPKIT